MNTHAGKTAENPDKASARSLRPKREEEDTGFDDLRPEAVQQHKLQETANQSTQNQSLGKQQALMQQKTARGQTGTHTMVNPNRTGLPDGLKAGIENLSGYSMDDVRVHYNSAEPAQMQAHAYAQGSHIHLAPGQERHLPHEAWHVVQQKQGRVKPTRQLKGKIPVNDDAGLEQEADRMGQRAQNSPFMPGAVPKAQAGYPAGTVQRKIGLEFQTLANLWIEPEADEDKGYDVEAKDFESAEVYKGMRKLLYGDKVFSMPGFFHIESDDGDVEFVTEPFDEDQAGFVKLTMAVQLMRRFAELIQDGRTEFKDVVAGFGTGTFDAVRNKGEEEDSGDKVYVGNMKDTDEPPDLTASPQASIGIRLDKIIDMYEAVVKDKKLSSFALWGTDNPAEHRSQKVTKDSLKSAKNADRSSKLDNFIFLVINYLQGAKAYSPDLTDSKNYPKVAHPVMVRTNFKSLYKQLSGEEQKRFAEYKNGYLSRKTGRKFSEPIYEKGYWDDNKKFHKPKEVLTISQWLDSIEEGGGAPDKLSRLPGMAVGRGMGAMKNVDQVDKTDAEGKAKVASPGAVFELRRMMTRVPPDSWPELAQGVHHAVNAIHGAKQADAVSAEDIEEDVTLKMAAEDQAAGNLNEEDVDQGTHPEFG